MPSTRAQRLRAYYRLSLDQYDVLAAAQGGVCAICRQRAHGPSCFGGRPHGPTCQGGPPLAVDHDHGCCPTKGRSCGRCVRGLLCASCNGLLGALEQLRPLSWLVYKDRGWITAALEYLRAHPRSVPAVPLSELEAAVVRRAGSARAAALIRIRAQIGDPVSPEERDSIREWIASRHRLSTRAPLTSSAGRPARATSPTTVRSP